LQTDKQNAGMLLSMNKTAEDNIFLLLCSKDTSQLTLVVATLGATDQVLFLAANVGS